VTQASNFYRPEIDGLRAVAILLVVLFHADFCTGGFVGVDVFFVISGYLITRLIDQELNTGLFSLRNFWLRRIRRLFPALILVSATTVGLGTWLLLPQDLSECGRSLVALWTLSSNWFFLHSTGYFQGAAETKPLLHTWSLAVEEQFYLIFPVLMVGTPQRRRSLLIGLLMLLSLGFSMAYLDKHASQIFYLLPGRAWELLLGCGLAKICPTFSRSMSETLGWLGLACILLAAWSYTPQTAFPGTAALLPCLGAALVVLGTRHKNVLCGRLLGLRPVVFCGLLSYSWYLWHWPAFAYCRYWALGPLSPLQRALIAGGTLLLSALTYFWVENPIRRKKALTRSVSLLGVTFIAILVLLVAGDQLDRRQGLPHRIPEEVSKILATGEKEGRWPKLDHDAMLRGVLPSMGNRSPKAPIHFILWGDSHLNHWYALLDEKARQSGMRGLVSLQGATPPLLAYNPGVGMGPKAIAYNQLIFDILRKHRIKHVILGGRWTWKYLRQEQYEQAVERTLRGLEEAGCEVWWVKQNPEHPFAVPRGLARTMLTHGDMDGLGLTLEEYQRRSQFIDSAVARHRQPHTHIVDPTPFFYPDAGRCRLIWNEQALFLDSDHATAIVAEQLFSQLSPIFEATP